MNKVNGIGKAYNMKISAKSTKLMVISMTANKPKVNITIYGIETEQIANFTYLGHLIPEDGKCDEETKICIGIAQKIFFRMSKVLTSIMISLDTRKHILQCHILSLLTYGLEIWSISKPMCTRSKYFEIWCHWTMLRISWTYEVRNEQVYCKDDNTIALYKTILLKKLKYFGNFTRHSTLQHILLEGKENGRRGRARATCLNNISKWTGLKLCRGRKSNISL